MIYALLGMMSLVLAFCQDAPAPQINYTYQDLAVPEEVAASQPIFLRYAGGATNSLDVGLSRNVLDLAKERTNLLPHAEVIEAAWTSCTEGRSCVDQLNQFPGITNWNNPDEQPDMLAVKIPSFRSHLHLCQLYVLHAKLCAQQGEVDRGIKVLSKHYTMVRKGLPYTTSLVSRTMFIAMADMDIDSVAQILQTSNLSREQLERMRELFSPLKDEELSLYRPILSEYVSGQYFVRNIRDTVSTSLAEGPGPKWLFYKPNRTLIVMKEYYEPMLEIASKESYSVTELQQETEARAEYISEIFSRRHISNFAGDMLLKVCIPPFTKANSTAIRTQVKSDLLAMETERRLDGAPDLKDPYTGEAYQYDGMRSVYFSVGADDLQGTCDDIYADGR